MRIALLRRDLAEPRARTSHQRKHATSSRAASRDVRRIVERADHRHRIGARGDQRRRIGRVDAADGDDADLRPARLRLGDQPERRSNGVRLHPRRIEAAERDVIAAGGDRGLRALERVVARHADDRGRPEPCARRRDARVVAAEMHAVGADRARELDVVVDDEDRPARRAERAQARRPARSLSAADAALLRYWIADAPPDSAAVGSRRQRCRVGEIGRQRVKAGKLRPRRGLRYRAPSVRLQCRCRSGDAGRTSSSMRGSASSSRAQNRRSGRNCPMPGR